MNELEIVNYIEECIGKLGRKFEQNPDYFISLKEQDLVAYLYHLICLNPIFLDEIDYVDENENNIKTKLIETQTPTFDKINKNIGSFDLTILNPNDNKKEDNLIAMEFKWIGDEVTKRILEIKADIDKINKKVNEVKFGYILVFKSDSKISKKLKDEILGYNKNPSTKIFFFERKEKAD